MRFSELHDISKNGRITQEEFVKTLFILKEVDKKEEAVEDFKLILSEVG